MKRTVVTCDVCRRARAESENGWIPLRLFSPPVVRTLEDPEPICDLPDVCPSCAGDLKTNFSWLITNMGAPEGRGTMILNGVCWMNFKPAVDVLPLWHNKPQAPAGH